MKKITTFFAFAILFTANTTFAQEKAETSEAKPINIEKQLKGFDNYANKLLKDWNCPGIGVGVVYKGKLVFAIGHEISHAFDDQGSLYDKAGNMNDWWAKEDKSKFGEKVKQIQKLYDGFPVFKDLNINGKLTTGENIADFGGVAIAYDAFKMTKQGQSNEKIDGFSPDQRFFLSYANSWRLKITDELTRLQVQTDPHSSSNWRINGPLMNFEPFYKAFDVKPGQKMYLKPEDRIKIW